MRDRSRMALRGWRTTAWGVVALLCAACTSGGDAAPGPTPSPGKERVLRVATASDVSQGPPVRQRLIEAWDERRRDVRVEFVKLPSAADDARAQLVAALQSGSADYDVVNIDVAWTAEFAAGGLIRPLDGELRLPEGMWPRVADTARFGGKTWAVPFNTDAALLYYRKDIWKDRNWRPPETWRELESYAADVRKKSQVKQTFPDGYATQLDEYEGLTVNAQEAVWARRGELVDGEGEAKAGTVETQAGLTDLVTRYRTIMPPEVRSADERDSLEMFRDGKVAFMRNWPYVYNVLSAEGSKVSGRFGVAPLPGVSGRGTSVLGGQSLAVTAGTEHPDDARALLAHLVAPEQQRCLLTAGFAPVLKESYRPGGARCSLPDGGGGTGGGESAGGGEGSGTPAAGEGDRLPPYTRALELALSDARPRPVTPYYAAFTELVQTKVHALLDGGTGDDGAVARDLDSELRRVVRGG